LEKAAVFPGTGSVVVLAVLLAAPLATAAAPRVAIIKSSSLQQFDQATDALIEVLRRDPLQPEVLTFDLEGALANSATILGQVREAHPQVIVTVGSLATAAALSDSSSVPVVFSMVLYPRQSGFLNHPSRKVTGVSLDVPLDLQFTYLRRLLPGARRVGVLYHPEETGGIVEAARAAAPAQGFELVAEAVGDPSQAVAALGRLMEKVEVVWTVADSHVFTPQTTSALILGALRHRIPLVGLSTAQVRAGAVAALYSDYPDVGRQTAEVVLKALRGDDPGGIPVAPVRTVKLALNLRTAEHVGMRIESGLEAEAGEVVR
jgi:putative ABC transport system substrate-binding protein